MVICPFTSQAEETAIRTKGKIASKPLFRDPVYDGAADPVLCWNHKEKKWFMFYTNRRANVPGTAGVSWVHGTPIGIAEHVDQLLNEQGIDLYRQDFNMDPLSYWRGADAADRQGISEIQHVTGYLAYWDELRRRHPDMLIDSCASGGRRNDIETMRRAVPLWRSDYAFEAIGHQCMMYGLSLWLPFHGTGR